MSNIFLLDCTLRDGGYVNNWDFGKDSILNIKNGLELANVDIIELGLFRNEKYKIDRTVFPNAESVKWLTKDKKNINVLYSVMIVSGDIEQLFPLKNLESPKTSGIDYIRICTWKRLMKEHFDYCKAIVEKGFKISIQPTAVEQYSEEEFKQLCIKANEVKPFSFYIVDTWGTQSNVQIRKYLKIAEDYLDKDIKIGYHGHNNKMQALCCAQTALEMGLQHDLCLDSSIFGMGRGCGNLQTEVIMDYLNENYNKQYNNLSIIELYEKYIKKFYNVAPWGYSLYHYLCSLYDCAPDFATYFKQNNLGELNFEKFLKSLTKQEKIVFNKDFVVKRIESVDLDKNSGGVTFSK